MSTRLPQNVAVRYLYERRAQAAVQPRGALVAHDGGERPADAGVVGRRRLRRQPGPQQVQRVRLQVGRGDESLAGDCYTRHYLNTENWARRISSVLASDCSLARSGKPSPGWASERD